MEDNSVVLNIEPSSIQEGCDFCLHGTEFQLLERFRDLPGRRSVWMARQGDVDLLLKVYFPHSKQVRDVGREWENALQLKKLGLNAAMPLFKGQNSDGAIALAFEYISGGDVFGQFLKTGNEQLIILKKLFKLHAQQHEAGCYQSDNHLNNYLLQGDEIYMLDAGSCQFQTEGLTHQQRVENLAMLIANIPLSYNGCIPESLKYYAEFCTDHVDTDLIIRNLSSAVPAAIQSRLWKYYKKTRRSCTEFERDDESGKVLLTCRKLAPALKRAFTENPEQFFTREGTLKDGNTCTVVKATFGGKDYVIKRYNKKGLGYRIAHMPLTPRALKSWTNGHVLNLFGVRTPRPLACLLGEGRGLLGCAYLLMENVEGEQLDRVGAARITAEDSIIPGEFSKRWNELKSLVATHGDMKASNFIVSKEGYLSLIDLDGLKFDRKKSEHLRRCKKDIKRFMKNWEKQSELERVFRDILAAEIA